MMAEPQGSRPQAAAPRMVRGAAAPRQDAAGGRLDEMSIIACWAPAPYTSRPFESGV